MNLVAHFVFVYHPGLTPDLMNRFKLLRIVCLLNEIARSFCIKFYSMHAVLVHFSCCGIQTQHDIRKTTCSILTWL